MNAREKMNDSIEPERHLDLAIVIVNYNVEALLRRCLQSIFDSIGDVSYAVCVVDNNSPDTSVQMVRDEFPQAHLIANTDNPGYSTANNQGIRFINSAYDSLPRYCLLLNPDTEVMPNTLADSVKYMDRNPGVGVMGPKLMLPNGSLDMACRRSFPSPEVSFYRMLGLSTLFPKSETFGRYNLTFLDEDELAEVDSVVGAFMLVRQTAMQQVGLLDEQFWMYGEDLDWAKRIKDRGWQVIYNPHILTLHVKRASSRQSRKAQVEFYRAMLIFYYKHYRKETPAWLHWLIMAGIGVKGGPPVWDDIQRGPAILSAA